MCWMKIWIQPPLCNVFSFNFDPKHLVTNCVILIDYQILFVHMTTAWLSSINTHILHSRSQSSFTKISFLDHLQLFLLDHVIGKSCISCNRLTQMNIRPKKFVLSWWTSSLSWMGKGYFQNHLPDSKFHRHQDSWSSDRHMMLWFPNFETY